jgi:hypothetical protein
VFTTAASTPFCLLSFLHRPAESDPPSFSSQLLARTAAMFKRSFRSHQPVDPNTRVDKTTRLKKTNSFRDPQKLSKLQRSLNEDAALPTVAGSPASMSKSSSAFSPIVTLTVGREGRLFAAHEATLCQSPYFEAACRGRFFDAQSRRISLPDEEPEVFSAVLEYLYKGDYYPRLLHNKHRNSWELEDSVRRSPHTSPHLENSPGGGRAVSLSAVEPTVYIAGEGQHLLRDTVIYCAAERYGLEELKRLALRKQGLQSGIDVGTILRSAQYAYAHTPDSDSRLRAHYLALIIRCRKTFKRSGTMQAEMERGGSKLFFDLFVAMCNHLDDVIEVGNSRTPKTI